MTLTKFERKRIIYRKMKEGRSHEEAIAELEKEIEYMKMLKKRGPKSKKDIGKNFKKEFMKLKGSHNK